MKLKSTYLELIFSFCFCYLAKNHRHGNNAEKNYDTAIMQKKIRTRHDEIQEVISINIYFWYILFIYRHVLSLFLVVEINSNTCQFIPKSNKKKSIIEKIRLDFSLSNEDY